MKTDAEFKQFYQDVIEKRIAEIEKLRKTDLKKLLLYFLIPIIALSLFSLFQSLYMIASIGYYLFIVGFLVMFGYTRRIYRIAFGRSVVSQMVSFIGNGLTYISDKGVQQDAVTTSGLFLNNGGSASSNYVEGQIGETFIQFSEIFLYKGKRTGAGRFKGIFLSATFNKYFNGDYFVFSGHHSTPEGLKKITLEDPEFNKAFSIYGSDEVEGRYILTPSMMQRMLDFKTEVNDMVYFSFTGSKMFIAIGSKGVKLFNPGLLKPVTYETLAIWNKYLQFAIGVVGEFDLNTRIWSKQ